MEKERWQKRSAVLLCAALVLLGIYLLLRYALGAFLPFITALAVALPLCALARRAATYFGGSVKAWSGFFVSVFWLTVALLLTFLFRRVYVEAQELADYLGENAAAVSDALKMLTDKAKKVFSESRLLERLGDIGERIGELAYSAVLRISEKGSEALAAAVGKVALSTPKAVVGAVVAVVSSFYLCCDFDAIKDYLLGFFSQSSQQRVRELSSRAFGGIKAYAKAYFWLFIITFSELFVGLLFLGRRYALVISLILALLDVLPLFGAGVIIVPWGIILIISGDVGVGVGMLVLVGIISIVRQIIEPRLVGKRLGIHPLASLASMYIGFRIFGFWGMLLAPVAVLVVKEMRSVSKENRTKD